MAKPSPNDPIQSAAARARSGKAAIFCERQGRVVELLSNLRFALLQALIWFSGEEPLPSRVVNRFAVRAERQNSEDLIGFACVDRQLHAVIWR